MKKTFGILAHVDAGKTTFSEQLLYHTKTIRQRGRVDHRNTFLDPHDIEKERGITVFANLAHFSIEEDTYYLLDTPGHADFSSEMERVLEVLDYALVIISGVDGIQGHTHTVWKLLESYGIPVFFFINKMDREGADYERIQMEISKFMTKDLLDLTCLTSEFHMSDEMIDWIAEKDDVILNHYFEEGYEPSIWKEALIKLIQQRKCFPCMSGSALLDEGVEQFLEIFHQLTYTDYETEQFWNSEDTISAGEKERSARVFKIRYDESGNRLTYMKLLSGRLKVKDELNYGSDPLRSDKINQIRIYNGTKYHCLDAVYAGDVFAVTGLNSAPTGAGFGKVNDFKEFTLQPAMKARVIYQKELSSREVRRVFRILEAEDPALSVEWEESLSALHINIMGTVLLEVLKVIVKERFQLDIGFGTPEVIYKESIVDSVYGYGHFEPLRHYAEVALLLESAARNSGIHYESKCHVDSLPANYQNLIKKHVFEKEHRGVLTGSSITDLKITLITGISHVKHTSGGDFREALYRAIRQGLEKASSILLEPYYRIQIRIPDMYTGKVLSDMARLCGTIISQEMLDDQTVITGRGPVSEFMNYSSELQSLSRGKGMINFWLDGYDLCHNSEEVIAAKNYNRGADIANTSCSVFCSKGTSFVVNWDEAEAFMHCLK